MASAEAGPARGGLLRALLAAALVALCLPGSGLPTTGFLSSYTLSLPVVVFSAGLLLRALPRPWPAEAPIAVAALTSIPALGERATRLEATRFDMAYIPGEHSLAFAHAAQATAATHSALLAALGLLGALVLLGRAARPALPLALPAALVLAGQAGRSAAAASAMRGFDIGRAARWDALAIPLALLPLLALLAGLLVRRPPRRILLLHLLYALLHTRLAWPLLPALLRERPAAPEEDASVAWARLPPGRSFAVALLPDEALRALDAGEPAPLRAWLRAQRFRDFGAPDWPCTPLPPQDWLDMPRNAVGLRLPGERRLGTLGPLLDELLRHGVHDLVLLARSPPQPGEVGQRMRWSGISLLLDRPPEGSHLFALDEHGWQRIASAEGAREDLGPCALRADPETAIQALLRHGRELSEPRQGGPCVDGLALLPLRCATGACPPAEPGCPSFNP